MSQFSWENEWRLQNLKEESFLVKHVMDKSPRWIKLVEKRVPATLQNTLETAFGKAFVTVFDKGAIIIEKTYRKEEKIKRYKSNQRHMNQMGFHGRMVRSFDREAKGAICKNLAIASVEGIGFGLIGWGIPDIPIFVSVMLKSIYEIALSYGFSYTSDREKLFILKVIDAALKSGEILREKDEELNRLIDRYYEEEMQLDERKEDAFVTGLKITRQIDFSSKALSHELLYGKFIQGTTVVGVIGGVADFTCLKRITDYAALKYKRRFLLRQMIEI